jgi:RNA polymerase sigma-70 factor (ECF subfamily)
VEPDSADELLAAGMGRGDVHAFGELYDRYAPRLQAWAYHALGAAEADDALQEVFLHMWQKAGQFDARRGRFRSWLMAIARHEFGRRLTRGDRARPHVAGERMEAILAAADPASDPASHVQERTVLDALAALPVEQRRVLVLGYFGGMSQSTMARELDIPLGTIKKRVRLGMQKLRAALADERADGRRLRLIADR